MVSIRKARCMNNEPEFLKPDEIAAMFQMSLKAISKWTQDRRIPGQCKVGGRWRYRRIDIEKALIRGELLNR